MQMLIKRKKAGVGMLILDKIDFRTRKITRDKEEHYIMFHQEDIKTLNVYATTNRASK